jgi:UDP-3-O-[3-hydroxymyristoyl] glucosamine N-acyltransferase
MANPFFKNNGPFKISEILKTLNLDPKDIRDDVSILDINDLHSSKINEITFFHSKKYIDLAKNTKASFCITTENFKNELSKNCKPIIVKNVLI